MADKELSLRIRVIAATQAGFSKALNSVKSFTNKASRIVRSGFRSARGTIPRPKTGLALGAIKAFTNKARAIIRRGFSRLASIIGRTFSRIARSIVRGVRNSIVALGALGVWSVKSASDFIEMEQKFSVVFGKLNKQTQKWANDYGIAINRSKASMMEYLSSFQDLFVPMGFTREKAGELSKQFVTLGLDLASFNNKADKFSLEKMHSALTGMYRPLREFGILLSAEKVNAEAAAMGFKKVGKEFGDQSKTLARLNLMYKMSKDAQGDATRTAHQFANRMKGLKEKFKDFRIEVGMQLIKGGKLTDLLKKLTKGFDNLIKKIKASGVIKKWAAGVRTEIEKIIKTAKPLIDLIKAIFAGKTGGVEDIAKKFKVALKQMGIDLQKEFGKAIKSTASIFWAIAIEFGKLAAEAFKEGIKAVGGLYREEGEGGKKRTSAASIKRGIKQHPFISAIAGIGVLSVLGKIATGVAALKNVFQKTGAQNIAKATGQGRIPIKQISDELAGSIGKIVKFIQSQRTAVGAPALTDAFIAEKVQKYMRTGKGASEFGPKVLAMMDKANKFMSRVPKSRFVVTAIQVMSKSVVSSISKLLNPLVKVFKTPLGRLLGKFTLVVGFLLDIYTILKAFHAFFKMGEADKTLKESMKDLEWTLAGSGKSTGLLRAERLKRSKEKPLREMREQALGQLKNLRADFVGGPQGGLPNIAKDDFLRIEQQILETLKKIDKDLGAQ